MRPDHIATLAVALQTAPTLAYFSLSGNELGVAGAKAIADAGGVAYVATLDLDTCALTEEAMGFIAAAIRFACTRPHSRVCVFALLMCACVIGSKPGSKLTSLNVSRNLCTGAALISVLRSPNCVLEVSEKPICLRMPGRLTGASQELVMVGCGLDGAQTAALLDAVSRSATLRRLNIWGLQCAAAAALVGDAVVRDSSLLVL